MSRIIRIAAAVLALALPLSAAAAVQTPREGLVADASRATQRRGVEVLHPLKADRAVFERAGAAGGAWMPATHGSPQFAKMQRTERARNGDWTWVGRVETDFGEQAAVITFGRDAVFGLIPQRHGRPLRIETRNGQTWLVENFPTHKVATTSDRRIPPLPVNEARAAGNFAAASLPGHATAAVAAEIDVLVVYNASMVTAYGSDSAVQTRINQVAALANQAYLDSSAAMHINIVAAKLLDYTAATDNGPALDLLTNASADPVKTQVDAWRNQYGADLVSLVRHFNNSVQTNCGLAWVDGYHGSPYNATYGFSVVSDGSDGGFFCYEQTFAHELGHNMGGGHDITTDAGDYGAYSYSRGHRANVGLGGFATVMAYPTGNQDVVSLFSSPLLTTQCLGQPCGIAGESDNVQTFGNSGPSIAAYRAHVNLSTLSIGDVTVTEGNSGTKLATFTATLSATSTSAVTFDIATSNGTATAGTDYVASSLTGQSIPAGSLTKTFSVTINGDATIEASETFNVTVSNVSGATLADGTAVGTIQNDDFPTLTINNVTAYEGNSGTKAFVFTVSLSQASLYPVSYTIGTVNGGATAGSDYVASTLTNQTIPAGSLTKTFSVTVNGDTTAEANEGFTVNVSAVTYAVVGDGSGVGNIVNDDVSTLSIADASVTEGNSGTKTLTFTVALSTASASAVTYNIATSNGTATAGSDYVASSLTGQSIPAGMLSKTFSVTLNGDTTNEANETFNVTVSAVTGATLGDGSAVGTLLNDDPTLTINDVTLFEGNAGTKTAVFTVSLSAISPNPVTYTIGTVNGAAVAGSDYVAKSLVGETIPAGSLTRTFSVTINGDTLVEANEAFSVVVSAVSGAGVGDGTGVGNLVNDDVRTLSIADASVTEGDSGTKTLVFTVALSQSSTSPVTYNIATSNGTAIAGSDYVASSLVGESIPAGMLSKTFSVTLNGDTAHEASETFNVTLSAASGASIGDGSAVGTISNDDPTLTINNVTVFEGNSGTKQAVFTVTLSAVSSDPVTYTIGTVNGAAQAGTDYVASTLVGETIPAGATSKTFSVTINGDTAVEANEAFSVVVSAVTGAGVGDGTGVANSVNDD
jgi:hypothetical protein